MLERDVIRGVYISWVCLSHEKMTHGAPLVLRLNRTLALSQREFIQVQSVVKKQFEKEESRKSCRNPFCNFPFLDQMKRAVVQQM